MARQAAKAAVAAPAPPPPATRDRVQVNGPATGAIPGRAELLAPPAAPERARADLELTFRDSDGLTTRSRGDLSGTLSGTVSIRQNAFLPGLKGLEGKTFEKDGHQTSIKSVSFDAARREYVIGVKTSVDTGIPKLLVSPLWYLLSDDDDVTIPDNYEIKLRADDRGRLELALEGNWIPDGKLLDALTSKIKEKLADIKNVNLKVERDGGRLYLVPEFTGIDVPLGWHEQPKIERIGTSEKNMKVAIDGSGAIVVSLDKVPFAGSSAPSGAAARAKPAAEQDQGSLTISLADYADKQRTINIGGSVEGHLDTAALAGLGAEGEHLDRFIKAGDVYVPKLAVAGRYAPGKGWNLRTDADLKIDLDKGTWLVGAHVSGTVDQGGKQVDVQASNITMQGRGHTTGLQGLHYTRDGDAQRLEVKDAAGPTRSLQKATRNNLRLIEDGDAFYHELLDQIRGAKESVHVETFSMSAKGRSQDVVEALALRAAGLELGDGKARAGRGVPTRLTFDWPGGGAHREDRLTYPPAVMVQRVHDTLRARLQAGEGPYAKLTPAQRDRAIKDLDANFKWELVTGGVTRADHRKVVVIDGKRGYTGGINLSESALNPLDKGGKHDVMVAVSGPAVRDLQREFLETWEEAAGPLPAAVKKQAMKSVAELERVQEQAGYGSKARVLVTDDTQRDIEGAIADALEHAQKQIRVEHAYFTDDGTIRRLEDALRRGVNVDVILPKNNDEPQLEPANRASIQQLWAVAKQSKGKLRVFHYKGEPQDPSAKDKHMNHTKALTVDGKTAIVGSANLSQRSLRGAAPGFLFNRELVLEIGSESFARKMDAMFDRDIKLSDQLDDAWVRGLAPQQKQMDKGEMMDVLF